MNDLLSITPLDTFQINYTEKFLKDIYSVCIQQLFTWFLLDRVTVNLRQSIAFQFWPESFEKQAKTNQCNLMYKLKKVLAEQNNYLIIKYNSVGWKLKASYSLDVDNFIFSIEKAKQIGVKEDVRRLTEVAEIYKNDLMRDCYRKRVDVKREY